jgi:hypothetical protein
MAGLISLGISCYLCSLGANSRSLADPNEVIALDSLDPHHSVAPYNNAFVKFASEAAVHHVCVAHTASIANYLNEMVGVDLPEDVCGTLVGKYFEVPARPIPTIASMISRNMHG